MGFLARCFPRVTYCVNVWMLLMFYCYRYCYIDDQRRGAYVLCMYSTIVHDQHNLCWICVKLFKISTHIDKGLNTVIFKGIFQYVVKLRIFFSMSRMHMLCKRSIEWSPYGLILNKVTNVTRTWMSSCIFGGCI